MHAYPRAQKRAFARLAAIGVAALASIGLSLGAAAPALAHDELVGTAGELSADGTRIDLTLSFSNEIMEVGTEIVATGPDGEDLIDGAPVVDGRDVTQGIAMPGFDRTVTVVWRVVSSDGHPINDRLAFAVLERDGGTELEFRDVPGDTQDEPAEHEHEDGHEDGDAGHEHGDEHEMTTQTADDDATANQPRWLWALVGVGAAGVVAAIATSAIVGTKRRRQAMNGDTGEGEDAETDK